MTKYWRTSLRTTLLGLVLLMAVFPTGIAGAAGGQPPGPGAAPAVEQQPDARGRLQPALETGKFKSWIFLPSTLIGFQPAPVANTIEENDGRVNYSGHWMTERAASASGGSFVKSTQVGSAAQLTFDGDSFSLQRTIGVEFGQAAVTIDGVYRGLLQFNFIETRYQVPAYFEHLGPGKHTLRLEPPPFSLPGSQVPAISLDAVTAPALRSPTPGQTQAVQHLNRYRQLAGIPPLTGRQAIHEAAQHHAEFYADHRTDPRMPLVGFHGEVSGLPGYTGFRPSQRANYFGYLGVVGEVGNFVGDAIANIDSLMNTVYHRALLLDYGYSDVGCGLVNDERGSVDVLDVGFIENNMNVPETRTIYVYPAAGQQDVPTAWNGMESPDPLPGLPRPFGSPISLYIVQPQARALAGPEAPTVRATAMQAGGRPAGQGVTESAILLDSGGRQISAYVVDGQTDRNGWFKDGDTIFLIPAAPLSPHSTYRATISGRDSQNVPFSRSWKFTTGAD